MIESKSLKVPREVVVMVAILYALAIALVVRLFLPTGGLREILSRFNWDGYALPLSLSIAVLGISLALGESLKSFYKTKSYSIFQRIIDFRKGADEARAPEARLLLPLVIILSAIYSAGTVPEVNWWVLVVFYLSVELFSDWLKERKAVPGAASSSSKP